MQSRTVVCAAILALIACSGGGAFLLRISFPDEQARQQAALLEVSVLEPGEGASCQDLMSAAAVPGDAAYPIEDRVEIDLTASETGHTLQRIGSGVRLFFAEARDVQGQPFLRGCVQERAGGDGAHEVAIALIRIEDACTSDEDCDDGMWCNGPETCLDGRCVEGEHECDDGDPCTEDTCDEDLDLCQHPPVTEPPAGEGSVGDPSCEDGVDNDCDGLTDEEDTTCRVCESDADCDDANTCTSDQCDQGGCVHQPTGDGTACDDGLDCTVDDSCNQGVCRGSERDCSHLDDTCSLGRCSEDLGACVAQPLPDGSPCDNGLFCTVEDTCQLGDCVAGTGRDCDDGDGCTLDACDEAADACKHELSPHPGEEGPWDDATCDDGQDNDCDGLTDIDDNDCAQCTVNGDCDDGNFCTTNTCQDGRCVSENLSDGTSCDDGLHCTAPDSCSSGVCGGLTRDCSHLDGDCTLGMCNESAAACRAEPANEGQSCEDEDPCTVEETCQDGDCAGGVPVDCSHLDDACNSGACDAESGACFQQPVAAGTACDDGTFCNGPDTCDGGGTCIPSGADPCGDCATCNEQADVCDPLPASSYCVGDVLVTCDGDGGQLDRVDCPLGCNENDDPHRCYLLDPSNLPQEVLCAGTSDVVIDAPVTIDTDAGTITGAGSLDFAFVQVSQGAGAPSVGVFCFGRLDIMTNVTVQGDNALALVACSDMIVEGVIDACASGQVHGPGGGDGGGAEQVGLGYGTGPGGAGEGMTVNPMDDSGGGGAAHGGAGGGGGDTPNLVGGAGGTPYDGASLVPLRGGSGGGGGGQGASTGAGPGGGGGGAVQIVAGGSVVIEAGAGINACGAGGSGALENGDAGGGGGSGGAVLIEAVAVVLEGTLAANGGGGGGGDESNGQPSEALPGEDGRFDGIPAAGGTPGGNAGSGAAGGAGDTPGGLTAATNENGGGGGGGAGRIRINSADADADINGTVTPDASTGLFTQGTVQSR